VAKKKERRRKKNGIFGFSPNLELRAVVAFFANRGLSILFFKKKLVKNRKRLGIFFAIF